MDWYRGTLLAWPGNVLTWRNGGVWEVMETTPEQDAVIKEFLSSYGRRSFMRGVYTCAIFIVALELIYYILSN